MSDTHDQVEATVYALGQPSRRTGLGGYSMKATIVGGAGAMAFLLFQLIGLTYIGLTVILPVTAVLIVLVNVTISGRSIGQILQMTAQDLSRNFKGENIYVSGPSSKIPGGQCRLPGGLARTELLTGVDAVGRDFGLIYDRPRREATVLLDCQFSGQTAVTQEERNQMTANWGAWLSGLSMSGDVIAAVAVVSTRPGTGQLIAKEVQSTVQSDAPWIAQQVMEEATEFLSKGVPEVDAHIALTFSVSVTDSEDTSFIDLLSTRLPALYEDLSWAGVQASPMDQAAIVARAHTFFNPASEPDFEELEVNGVEHGLTWLDAGPLHARTLRDRYVHDGVSSVTWEMADAPRSTFQDTLLGPLLVPYARVRRKRVAVVYRPFDAGVGAAKVEAEHRDALVAANSSKKVRAAAAEGRVEHTDNARRSHAKGAQLGRYSLFVTATIGDDEQLRRVTHDVERLGAQANIRLRSMKRQQDAGFVVSAGLGQLPWLKSSTSTLLGD